MIKLLTFDLDHTLWDVDPIIITAENTLQAWLQAKFPAAYARYTDGTAQQAYQDFKAQHPDRAKLPTASRKQVLQACFKDTGLSEQACHAAAETAFEVFIKARNAITLAPSTLSLLEALSRQYTLIALSNGNADLNRIGIRHLFAGHFSADSTERPKPDPTMFLTALYYGEATPEQAIHIGDHPIEDVKAAQSIGMHTIWFRENEKFALNLCKPDIIIPTLDQLTDSIQQLHR